MPLQPAGHVPIAAAGRPLTTKEIVLPPRRANRRQQNKTLWRTVATTPMASGAPSPTTYRPSANVPLQGVEVFYFDLFRSRTAAELSGYFDDSFWTRRVLQECHNEAAVRHSVIALGALYKTLEQKCRSASPSNSDSEGTKVQNVVSHWQVAVRKYSEACNAMMHLDDRDPRSHRTRLIAGVLLGSFDGFIGDHKQAIIQIQNGLGLLGRVQAEEAVARSGQPMLEEEVLTVFNHLAVQAMSYDMAFHFPEPYVVHLGPERTTYQKSGGGSSTDGISLEQPFFSIREARRVYDRICESGMRFLDQLYLARQQPYPLFPEDWVRYSVGIQENLGRWSIAFQPLLAARHDPGKATPQEKAAIAVLKMTQLNGQILMSCIFNRTECYFDNFVDAFRQIVELAEEVVRDDEARARMETCRYTQATCPHQTWDNEVGAFVAAHIKPSFAADLGIVPPIWLVATKCREPRIRRRAIKVLHSSARREGMWDSAMAAKIAQWVMEVEEKDARGGMPTSMPGSEYPIDINTPYGYLNIENQNQTGPYNMQPQGNQNDRPYPPPPPLPPPQGPIAEERRVMIQKVDFDLRTRFANLTVGTRGAMASSAQEDKKFQTTQVWW
ncbi:hypothetical protein N3K66_006686 [Trichothecium roseum]|uniref:Uncharacterized protein n=1 Tax=Trichothecium roseum TaxID=47278 RepID=A0ACC0UW23_9HYPO|nr:hypothetical protein N3K66_006686 [Trichothecium roseum]